uniref:BZIP domain-containing protein n=1 Tax=Strongyloides stercoralis TaxID=6248 RepID=A0A0K0EC99_STRER
MKLIKVPNFYIQAFHNHLKYLMMNNFISFLCIILFIDILLIKPHEEKNQIIDENSLKNENQVMPVVLNDDDNHTIEKRQMRRQNRQRRRRRRARLAAYTAIENQIRSLEAVLSQLQSQIAAITPAG